MHWSSSNSQFIGQNILIVTAHPDDEAAFYSNVIRSLYNQNKRIYLLTLSAGEYGYDKYDENLGKHRLQELKQSCEVLGILEVQIYIGKYGTQLNYAIRQENLFQLTFKDGKHQIWSINDIQNAIDSVIRKEKQINSVEINSIISFDSKGVSGHNNHVATGKGVRAYVEFENKKRLEQQKSFNQSQDSYETIQNSEPHNNQSQLVFYELKTRKMIERAFGPIAAGLRCKIFHINNTTKVNDNEKNESNQYIQMGDEGNQIQYCAQSAYWTASAMWKHRSQMRWFRVWLTYLSSYSYSCTISRVF